MSTPSKRGKVLPFPLRVAAGLAVTATEQVRWLPGRVVGLPITVASRALQTAMRMQQQVTTLAIKGDDALSAFKPAQESPPWATFDEDVADGEDLAPEEDPPEEDLDPATFGSIRPEPGAPEDGSGATLRPINGVDAAAGARASADVAPIRPVEPVEATGPLGSEAGDPEDPWLSEQRELGRTHADGEGDSDPRASPPAAFPNYDELTLPQLRARLRRFSLADLHELLDYERAHAGRPDFTKMLAKRIDTVRAEQ